jgi:5-(carboxyamino)imidazole ribonucleotide mutase
MKMAKNRATQNTPKIKIQAKAQVAIIMGSDSDWKKLQKAALILKGFGVISHLQVVSAHRTPYDLPLFAKAAEAAGIQVLIAGAGGAAHLPGMIAAFTTLPVIGVPIEATKLKGLDALLSIAQMPEGIPVACMAIENSGNAALLALRILALQDSRLKRKLEEHQDAMAIASRKKTRNLK